MVLQLFVEVVHRRVSGGSVLGGALQMVASEPLYIATVFLFGASQGLLILLSTSLAFSRYLASDMAVTATLTPDLEFPT